MTEIERKVDGVLAGEVNPRLMEHKGWAELVTVGEDGVAVVRFRGACSGCDRVHLTLGEQVAPAILRAVPEVRRVEADDGVSEELINLARSLMGRGKSGQ